MLNHVKNKLKVAVAGYGVVGKRRRFFIDKHPYLETIAACDIKFKKSDIDHLSLVESLRLYDDYKNLLNTEAIDILFVCMTNDMAPLVTIDALKKGIHVFCEKPPGRTVFDIENVISIEKQYPALKLMYGFNHRYHDSILKAFDIITSGELGKVLNMRGVYGKSKIISYDSSWRSQRNVAGGGILLDQGIHMIDLMRMLSNSEFIEYKSYVSNSFWGYDVEDNAYALMKTKNNIICFLHSTATLWKHRFNLEISLEKGYLILSGILSSSKSYGREEIVIGYRPTNDNYEPQEVIISYAEDNSWQKEIEYFAKSILENTKIQFGSSYDALMTMKTVYNIYEADQHWYDTLSGISCDN